MLCSLRHLQNSVLNQSKKWINQELPTYGDWVSRCHFTWVHLVLLPLGTSAWIWDKSMIFPIEAHSLGSAQNRKPSGLCWLQHLASWTPSSAFCALQETRVKAWGELVCTIVLHGWRPSLGEWRAELEWNGFPWKRFVQFFLFPYTFLKQIYC